MKQSKENKRLYELSHLLCIAIKDFRSVTDDGACPSSFYMGIGIAHTDLELRIKQLTGYLKEYRALRKKVDKKKAKKYR